MNARKPMSTRPMMPKTRAIISSESRRLAKETAKAHQESVTDQNRIEPSWLPQVAATLKYQGKSE